MVHPDNGRTAQVRENDRIRREIEQLVEMRFLPAQLIFRTFAFSNVRGDTDVFFDVVGFALDASPHTAHLSDRPVAKDDAIVDRIAAFLTHGFFKLLLDARSILWVNRVQNALMEGLTSPGSKPVKAILFFRPDHFAGGKIPAPASGAADSLPFGEESLAAA